MNELTNAQIVCGRQAIQIAQLQQQLATLAEANQQLASRVKELKSKRERVPGTDSTTKEHQT